MHIPNYSIPETVFCDKTLQVMDYLLSIFSKQEIIEIDDVTFDSLAKMAITEIDY